MKFSKRGIEKRCIICNNIFETYISSDRGHKHRSRVITLRKSNSKTCSPRCSKALLKKDRK